MTRLELLRFCEIPRAGFELAFDRHEVYRAVQDGLLYDFGDAFKNRYKEATKIFYQGLFKVTAAGAAICNSTES